LCQSDQNTKGSASYNPAVTDIVGNSNGVGLNLTVGESVQTYLFNPARDNYRHQHEHFLYTVGGDDVSNLTDISGNFDDHHGMSATFCRIDRRSMCTR